MTTPNACVILPREATKRMLFAANTCITQNDPADKIWDAIIAASPSSGAVTEEMLEAAAAAAFNSLPWEETPLPEKVRAVYAIRRALSVIGLTVEG
jgi:hypothetical protein